MHQPILGITLSSFRCSLTPNTVSVSDRPAHLVSVSGPRMGLSVLDVMTVENRTFICLDVALLGTCGRVINV